MVWTRPDIERLLSRIRHLVAKGQVRFTEKALNELDQLDIGLDETDCVDVIANLAIRDYFERLRSDSTADWLHVFIPVVHQTRLDVKLAVRRDCVVISFHEQDETNAKETH